MKAFGRLLAYVFYAQLVASAVSAYEVPPGSVGFYHGNSSAAVTFDQHSMFLDGKRVYIFSGEIHVWRAPTGPALWRDLFQKFKAAGMNCISVYHHWGLTEGKRGELNFEHYRSHKDLYDIAQEVGLLVISRPGPYINAETNAGGFPGWVTNDPSRSRTNDPGWFAAWEPYIKASSEIAKPYQYPDGPIIAVQAENEFSQGSGRSEYMVQLQAVMRDNGITKVPITHNDARPRNQYANGLGHVDLYLWDFYPQGFNCANPGAWPEVDTTGLDTSHQTIYPDVMWGSGEFGGGAFDPWGGSGYDKCALLTNEQYANVQYKNNLAVKTTLQNIYMTFGGTNWGNLAEPTVYTSYDYGAPVREDRTLTPKYSEIKLQAGFLHASPDYLVSTRFGNGTTFTNSSSIYTTALGAPSGANFYIIRQTTTKNLDAIQYTIQVNTTEGPITVPQFGGVATLDGRESQIIVSEYPYGKHKLKYSTAEVYTWNTIDNVDNLILYANKGHPIETVVSGVTSRNVKVSGSRTVNARLSNGTLVITGTPSGISTVTAGDTNIIIADRRTAFSFWNVHLSAAKSYDRSPDTPSVFVFGPYLVRTARIAGSTLALQGDVNATTTVDVVAPSAVRRVTWNGRDLPVRKSDIGTLRGTVRFSVATPRLPDLKKADWRCTDSLPEIQPGFDDSQWITANKTSTARQSYQPYGGKYVLYADEYGFHQGNTISRGHFQGKNVTGVQLSVQGGYNFGYSAWINSKFLGSSQGVNQYSTGGGIDLTNNTWTFDAADLNDGDNVLTVVVDPTGLEEDHGGAGTFKTPRGIRGYTLLGGTDFDYWKIQGNLGGEDYPDKVRGPLNEGGLLVERQGAHLPGYSAASWTKSCTPLTGISSAGIRAYRTTFNLNIPVDADVPIALKITRTPTSSYRSVIYINGWQFGRFNSRDGPQEVFPLPEGILNHRGKNELLVTIWSLDAEGAKMADIELITTAVVSSSKDHINGVVTSPTYQELRKH